MKPKPSMPCVCGHSRRRHAKDGTICAECYSSELPNELVCERFTPKGKESAVSVVASKIRKPLDVAEESAPSKPDEDKVSKKYIEKPIHPFERWCDSRECLLKVCGTESGEIPFLFLEKHRELCKDHLICPQCEKSICSHTNKDMADHEQKLEQAAFERGKMLSKEVHCEKHGWACTKCDVCVKEAGIDVVKLAEWLLRNVAAFWTKPRKWKLPPKTMLRAIMRNAKEAIDFAKR